MLAGEQQLEMSYDAYLEWLEWIDDDTVAEWVEGVVTVFAPPKTMNQMLLFFLHSLLNDYVCFFNLGVVLTTPFEMLIQPGVSSRRPDLLYIARERIDQQLQAERLVGPADLVVEIVSEWSFSRDRHEKYAEYQHAGVKEYWLIDPRPGAERIDVYQLCPDGRYQRVGVDSYGRYVSGVLPGFWLYASWLWDDMFPNAQQALAAIAPQAMRDVHRS